MPNTSASIKSSLLLAVMAAAMLAGCVTTGGGEYREHREYRESRPEYRQDYRSDGRSDGRREEQSRYAPPRSAIRISNASYGAGRNCDATGVLRRACDGRSSCAVEASNRLCGDPAPGVHKELRIEYSCGGRGRHGSAAEGRDARLSCD